MRPFWPLKVRTNRISKQLCAPRKARNILLIETWNSHAVICLHHGGLKDATEYHEICSNISGGGDAELAEGMMEWDLMDLTSNEEEGETPMHCK